MIPVRPGSHRMRHAVRPRTSQPEASVDLGPHTTLDASLLWLQPHLQVHRCKFKQIYLQEMCSVCLPWNDSRPKSRESILVHVINTFDPVCEGRFRFLLSSKSQFVARSPFRPHSHWVRRASRVVRQASCVIRRVLRNSHSSCIQQTGVHINAPIPPSS